MTVTGPPARAEATDPAAEPRRRRGALSPMSRGRTLFAWAMTLPALALFIFVFVIPIGYAGYLSTFGTQASGAGMYAADEATFVGLSNYADVLADSSFWASLRRLAIYAFIMVPLLMGTSILLALMLDLPRARARTFSRVAVFLPYGVPSVIASLMWGFIYVPQISPFHQLASAVGVELPNLLDGDWIYAGIINVVLWGGIGFNMIIIYTALQSLAEEQIDAARLDGCGEWRIAWYIKLPHVIPATIVTGLFSIIAALQIYSEPTMLSTLTTAIHSTFFPLMRVYRDAFAHDDLSIAAAASILLALGTVLLSLLVLVAQRVASRRSS